MKIAYRPGKKNFSWFLSLIVIVSMMGGALPALAAEDGNPSASEASALSTVNPNGDLYAYVPYTPGGPAITYAFENPQVGIVNLAFDVIPLEDSVEGHIAFNTADYTMGFTNERKIDIILTPRGRFAANDNTATKEPATPITYTKGQTYHVTVSINIAAKTFSASVDGQTLATNLTFRDRNPRTITNIGVMGVSSLSGSFKVKNFSEKLKGLVDNDTVGMDESNNPAGANGVKVYYVGAIHKFKKVQDVIALLQPGDTVEVDGNAIYPAPIYIDASFAGTKDRPITIKGITKNGAKPVLKTLNALNMVEINADNYVLDNFEIAGNMAEVFAKYPGVTYSNIMDQPGSRRTEISNQTVYRGVFHKADNLVVRNCVIHDARMGILGSDIGSGSILVEYNNIYHNGTNGGHHNLYLAADEVAHPNSVARVQYNYIHDSNSGNGLKSRAGRNEVYYNWFENNYYQSLELIGPDPNFDFYDDNNYAFVTTEQLRAINPAYGEFFRREDSDVVGNVITHVRGDLVRIGGDGTSDMSLRDANSDLVLGADGHPVKVGPSHGQTYGRYRFVNNTFIDYKDDTGSTGRAHGLRIEFGVESVEMYNNVFYKPVGNPLSVVAENTNPDEINRAKWASGSRQVKGANNWVQNGALDVPGANEWIGTIMGTDPGFVDASPAVKNYNLQPNSPLRVAGASLDKTVAVWPNWTNTLPEITAGLFPVATFHYETYFGTPVTLSNQDNAFPIPIMSIGFHPVDHATMTVSPRPVRQPMDIGAFAGQPSVYDLIFLVNRLIASGDIKGPLTVALTKSLEQAERYLKTEKGTEAVQQLDQFLQKLLKSPLGRGVPDSAKNELIQLAESLKSSLEKK